MMPNLPVPHRKQLDIGYCLPACLEMVLAYLGIERNQADLASQLDLIPGVGVPSSRVQRLVSHRLAVTHTEGEPSHLLAALGQGHPIILNVMTRQLPYWSEDTYHALVFTGIEGNLATVNDPAFGQPIMVSFAELVLAWDDAANLYTVLTRKG
jgi:ABC-type bacteriocin/lantibiotic exporter with double-glycine peptidase domain